jgi:hypothetical protein
MRKLCFAVLALLLACALSAQEAPTLHVSGTSVQAKDFTSEQLASIPRTTVTVKHPSGKEQKYEGVRLSDLLKKAGVVLGEMRSPEVRSYVVATAPDKYKAVYSLAELDPAITSNEIIVADKLDGQPLDAKHGPFQVIAPGDKVPWRWIHMVNSLEVVEVGK